MSIASAITAKQQQVADAYTAASGKGATMPHTQDLTNLATCIASISSGGSQYSVLQRITDDNNNEIGTVSGFFTDANNVEYAVVCLDAQYRLASGQWCSTTGVVTNMPVYATQAVYSATETATENTQLILDFCASRSATSTACSHCRSQSFTIGGVTYYGQFPNIVELIDIFRRRIGINAADTSAGSYSSLVIPTETATWSSTQYDASTGWHITNKGAISDAYRKTMSYFVIPVLEIPVS